MVQPLNQVIMLGYLPDDFMSLRYLGFAQCGFFEFAAGRWRGLRRKLVP